MTECFLPPSSSPAEQRRAEHPGGVARTPSSEEISPTKFPGLYRTGEPSPPHDGHHHHHEAPDAYVSDDDKEHSKKKNKFKKKEKRSKKLVLEIKKSGRFLDTLWLFQTFPTLSESYKNWLKALENFLLINK